MKFKTTAKAIRNGSVNPVSVGYADLQTLLRFKDPNAYTCGIYGWNFDVYEVYGVTICTGYRGMVGRRADGIREYEEKARAIVESRMSWEEQRDKIEELLHEFCKLNGGY